MVLLIYHYDKSLADETFTNVVARLDLGFFPKEHTYLRFKQIGFSTETLGTGGTVNVEFPDMLPSHSETERIDKTDLWESPGFVFSARRGEQARATGRFDAISEHYDLNLDLGPMDPQKDYVSIIINGRRAAQESSKNNLGSISIVLEMQHHNRAS